MTLPNDSTIDNSNRQITDLLSVHSTLNGVDGGSGIENKTPRYTFLDPVELLNRPPRKWLVYPLIGVGDNAMVFGESGKGKTFVVIDLVMSLVLAERFAEHFEVYEKLNVAYCAGEGTGALAERFNAAIAARGVDPASLDNLFVCLDVPNLFDDRMGLLEFAAAYKATGREKLDLLVIDTLHTATSGANENSTQDAGKILDSMRWLQKELGCAVLVVHHANRAGTGERGSSAFRGAMDVIVEVNGSGDQSLMKCSKLKDGQPFAPIGFSLVAKEDSARVFWEGPTAQQNEKSQAQDDALAFLRSYPNRKFKSSTIGEGIGRSRQATNQLMAKLYNRGDVQREPDPKDEKTMLYWYAKGESESR